MNMKNRNQHSIQIPPIQSNLKSILTKRMKMEDVAVGDCPVGSVVEEMDLCDFGTKFRILVLQAKHEKRIELHVSVPGDALPVRQHVVQEVNVTTALALVFAL